VIDREELQTLLRNDLVKHAMIIRCAEQQHDWENCCSVTLQVYQRCKWCGEER
jgi:hypothetical protein